MRRETSLAPNPTHTQPCNLTPGRWCAGTLRGHQYVAPRKRSASPEEQRNNLVVHAAGLPAARVGQTIPREMFLSFTVLYPTGFFVLENRSLRCVLVGGGPGNA